MNITRFILTIFIAFPILCFSQELPPINSYAPNIYNAGRQNWAITQANNKNIFIANNKGLLEFNGAKWKLYKSPNESIMRSVKAVRERIYSGSYMDFGFWTRDVFGELNYESLSSKFKVALLEDEEFWNIIEFEGNILFQSLDRIYIYDIASNIFKILNSNSRITKVFQVDDAIYFQRLNDGIYKIENGKDVLFIKDPKIKNDVVVNIFSENDDLLLQTQNNGIYLFRNNELKEWEISKKNELSRLSVYNSFRLNNKNFVFGTISKGLVYLNNNTIEYEINQSNGLLNNTVLSLFEDIDNNIWLGLDNGINSLNTNSPFKVYHDDEGLLGSVYTSALKDGFLYLGTNQGLFYKKLSTIGPFRFMNGTKGQVWDLNEIDNVLFCGHNSGTFIVENKTVTKISEEQGIWSLKQIPNSPNLILQGGYNGLSILEKKNGKWFFRNIIEGFKISSRFFEIFKTNNVMLPSFRFFNSFLILFKNSFFFIRLIVEIASSLFLLLMSCSRRSFL